MFFTCLGAEKALFRALKTKKDTPKYGLIYHAQLIGQASTKNKGKIARSLAAKASLATRVSQQTLKSHASAINITNLIANVPLFFTVGCFR